MNKRCLVHPIKKNCTKFYLFPNGLEVLVCDFCYDELFNHIRCHDAVIEYAREQIDLGRNTSAKILYEGAND